jgi:hypothetical protein
VVAEPAKSELRDPVECAGLFEQVGRARNDRDLVLATELLRRGVIQREHLPVVPTDDEQRRRFHKPKARAGQVRAATARDDCAHNVWEACGRPEGRRRSGACAEVAQRELSCLGSSEHPAGRGGEPAPEQPDLEDVDAVDRLLRSEEIEPQRAQAGAFERPGNGNVPWARVPTPAAVGEEDGPHCVRRDDERRRQVDAVEPERAFPALRFQRSFGLVEEGDHVRV